jgi:hypothetical protein
MTALVLILSSSARIAFSIAFRALRKASCFAMPIASRALSGPNESPPLTRRVALLAGRDLNSRVHAPPIVGLV